MISLVTPIIRLYIWIFWLLGLHPQTPAYRRKLNNVSIERISNVSVSFQAQVIYLLIFTLKLMLNLVGLKVVANYSSNDEISEIGEKPCLQSKGPQNGQEFVWEEIENNLDMG